MKYVLGFDIGGTKSAVLLVSPDKEHVVFLERKSIPTHGTWKEVLGCLWAWTQDLRTTQMPVPWQNGGMGLARAADT